MSDSDAPTPLRDKSNDTSGERRREARRVLVSQCAVSIISPAWAITRQPLTGRTININTFGMKVGAIQGRLEEIAAWSQAVADDVDLRVEVTIEGHDQMPILTGRLVWVYPEEPTAAGPCCSFGILFSVMKEDVRLALADLVHGLPDRF
jgi:hypothetical protein